MEGTDKEGSKRAHCGWVGKVRAPAEMDRDGGGGALAWTKREGGSAGGWWQGRIGRWQALTAGRASCDERSHQSNLERWWYGPVETTQETYQIRTYCTWTSQRTRALSLGAPRKSLRVARSADLATD